jgi:hypothetical protein
MGPAWSSTVNIAGTPGHVSNSLTWAPRAWSDRWTAAASGVLSRIPV